MMRIQSGVFCVLAMVLAFACAESTGDDGDGVGDGTGDGSSQVSCGDGACSPSEIGVCQADCGNGSNGGNNQAVCGNGQCETTLGENGGTCAADCGGGSGSGSGSGSGGSCTLDPNDPFSALGCLLCALDPTACAAPFTAAACAACGF